ncbi:MAG: glycosyltransferase family 4 protein [Chitinophagaceae bacterium]|nr:glycosyltransferase family 4 protein [Chitinophagaceae bacterium]
MRILHVIYTHGVGGAEKYLKHLLPGLKAYGIDCDLIVVCTKKTESTFAAYCNEVNSQGIRTTLVVAEKYGILTTAKKVNNYLKEEKINILHTHLFHADLMAAFLKTFFNKNIRIISTKHGYQEKVLQQYDPVNYKKPNDLYYHITKYILRKIDINIAVSKAMADLYFNLGISNTHFPYIHHGITFPEFDKPAHGENFRNANPQLITVGRIEIIKGHHFLIDAMPAILEVFPQTKLLVLGDGTEKANCEKRVKEANLEKNVEFMGFVEQPYQYINNSDIVIQPSFFESFGLVFIEGLALKTPIVAFDVPAGNEILENNKTALLVNKGDSKALAEKIIYLLQNPDVAKQIAENAYEKYKSEFTTEAMVKKMAAWYKSLSL